MLRCLQNATVGTDNCYWCCVYCNENQTCEYACEGLECWENEKTIASQCIFAYEEDENIEGMIQKELDNTHI